MGADNFIRFFRCQIKDAGSIRLEYEYHTQISLEYNYHKYCMAHLYYVPSWESIRISLYELACVS